MKTTTRMTSFRLTLGLLACCLAALPVLAGDIVVDTTEDTLDGWCTTLPWPPDNCSLRKALTLANETPGKDTIHLQPGTYVLSRVGALEDLNVTGDLDILDDVDIKGVGVGLTIIDGNQTDRVFHVRQGSAHPDPPMLQLFDLTVQHGTGYPGGGIFNSGGALPVALRGQVELFL